MAETMHIGVLSDTHIPHRLPRLPSKVIEAMATGTPVVTTPQASTALLAREGEHFLIGKSADDFAAQVVRLLNGHDLAVQIGVAGRQYVETHHDWNHLAARLEAVYQQLTIFISSYWSLYPLSRSPQGFQRIGKTVHLGYNGIFSKYRGQVRQSPVLK